MRQLESCRHLQPPFLSADGQDTPPCNRLSSAEIRLRGYCADRRERVPVVALPHDQTRRGGTSLHRSRKGVSTCPGQGIRNPARIFPAGSHEHSGCAFLNIPLVVLRCRFGLRPTARPAGPATARPRSSMTQLSHRPGSRDGRRRRTGCLRQRPGSRSLYGSDQTDHAVVTIRPNGDRSSLVPMSVYTADMTLANGSSPTLAARRRLGMAAAARAPTPTTAAPTHMAGRRPSTKVAGLT